MQRGVVAIPKSTHAERIAENFDIFDFVRMVLGKQQVHGFAQ